MTGHKEDLGKPDNPLQAAPAAKVWQAWDKAECQLLTCLSEQKCNFAASLAMFLDSVPMTCI